MSAEQTRSSLLAERKTWLIITLGWGALGIGSWILEYAISFAGPDGPMTLGRAAARLVYAALWWSATVFGVLIGETFTVRRPLQVHLWMLHILVGGVVAVAWAVVAYYVNLAIIPDWIPLGVDRMIHSTFMTSYLPYAGIIIAVHVVIFWRESRGREISALQKARLSAETELQALKMELQPHFLFNTLNTISTLMERDPEGANEVLVLVADMLEIALANVRDQEVTLEEELDTLKLYVQIQQIRFGDRLRVEYDIDPDTLNLRVPHMLLQPIVENAIKHGISGRAAGGWVKISARVLDEELQLIVQDDGVGLRNGRTGSGVGLKNTRERLGVLYGDRHRFELRNGPNGGACAEISIPLARHATLDADRR